MAQEITAAEVKRLMIQNYRRFHNGDISESKAFKENVLLGNILKAIEVSEQSERLAELERTIHSLRNED